jgi:hypothetical protein
MGQPPEQVSQQVDSEQVEAEVVDLTPTTLLVEQVEPEDQALF